MTCDHSSPQFGCNSCREKVKFFENNIDYYLHQIEQIKNDLAEFYEDEDCSDSVADWLDGAINTIEKLLLEISHEAELDQSKRHFSSLVRSLFGIDSYICSNSESSER